MDGVYDESADIWSLACMTFELVTGDYLFDPKKGKTYRKNDDHLALISELLGEPKGSQLKHLQNTCEGWTDYYQPINSNSKSNNSFKLKRIKNLKFWPLKKVLVEKYRIKDFEA